MDKDKAIAIATKFAQENCRYPFGELRECIFADYSEITIVNHPSVWMVIFSLPGDDDPEGGTWVYVEDKTGRAYFPLRM